MRQTPSQDEQRRGFQGLPGCWALLVLGSTLVLAFEVAAWLTLGYPARGILQEVDWRSTRVLRVDIWLSWFHPYGVGSRGIAM